MLIVCVSTFAGDQVGVWGLSRVVSFRQQKFEVGDVKPKNGELDGILVWGHKVNPVNLLLCCFFKIEVGTWFRLVNLFDSSVISKVQNVSYVKKVASGDPFNSPSQYRAI